MHCNNCKTILKQGLACTICKDCRLCTDCFEKIGHQHEMKQLILSSSDDLLSKDQAGECGLHFQVDPLHRFVQGLSRGYKKHSKNTRGACRYIFEHLLETNLMCKCIFCKKMVLLYKYHSTKCQIPNCSFEDCTVINEKLFKRPLPSGGEDALILKLMQLRFVLRRTQAECAGKAVDQSTIIRNLALTRKFTIQRCIRTLVHACQCVETNCMPTSCQKMKRILAHIKVCKRKVVGGCIVCKQLCTLCCYHAKSCQESKCSVLLCSYIKRKLRESKTAPKKRCAV